MKVVKNFTGDADYGVLPYIQPEFDKLSEEDSDIVFFNGVQFIDDPKLLDPYMHYKRRVLFAHWSPCEFIRRPNLYYFDAYERFTEVYCVCPFTVKFMNDYFGEEKFIYIPYPYTNYSIGNWYEYDSASCWFGSINGDEHASAIDTISKFKYKYITSQKNTWLHHPYEYNKCTHVNLTTEAKLKQVSKCKSSLTFNKLYRAPGVVVNHGVDGAQLNIWQMFQEDGTMPQFKVRTHEIATCKSLILCKKDYWNLIEDFYTEGEHFLYFESNEELEEIIADVDSNIDKYLPIIENAFERVQDFSVEKIFEFMKTKDENLITWRNKHV